MVDPATARTVVTYKTRTGRLPLNDWLFSLKDHVTRRRILKRLRRLGQGNLGDCKPVGIAVFELRLMFGPGYRIYFGEDGKRIIVLLTGGDKNSQGKEIETAISYWQDYISDA